MVTHSGLSGRGRQDVRDDAYAGPSASFIGHGVEVDRRFYCCAHCARLATKADVKDRAA
jgi:hypothetical protein